MGNSLGFTVALVDLFNFVIVKSREKLTNYKYHELNPRTNLYKYFVKKIKT